MNTDDSISLAVAQKQATVLLAQCFEAKEPALVAAIVKSPEFQEYYTSVVRDIFFYNKHIMKGLSDRIPQTVSTDKPKVAISDKQKACPNCGELIPKGWTRHDKCGWV